LTPLPFSYLHVLAIQPAGTPAAKYPGQVHPTATKERSRRLRELAQAKKKAFAERFLGQELAILLEGKRDKTRQFLSGLTEHYIRVHVDAPETSVNQLVPVRLVALAEDEVLGEWLGEEGAGVEPVKQMPAAHDANLHPFL
jgi:threonylcarbamoyladenosine tRNA methylthiotransferase MtaB